MAKALWEAPFAVLSHDKFENEDPVFTYANKVCLERLLCSCKPFCSELVEHPYMNLCSILLILQAALDLFEATWDELVGMPSRKSAADEAEVSNWSSAASCDQQCRL